MKKKLDPLPEFDITPILQHLGMEMVPSGFGWVRCHCFAHDDRTPSASVNLELNAFRCHSCQRKGDALKLLQTELNLSFVEALELARQLTGVDSSDRKPRRKRRASELLNGGGGG